MNELDKLAASVLPMIIERAWKAIPYDKPMLSIEKYSAILAYNFAEAFMAEKAMRDTMREVLDTSDKPD